MKSKLIVIAILMINGACGLAEDNNQYARTYTLSLTGSNYTGKKYYLGWGAADGSDPKNMHNETKYDIQHTNDIFTNDIGGKYEGTALTGYGKVSTSEIRSAFETIKSKITPNDQFVQMSSGHGYSSGLQFGGKYSEIADRLVGLNIREVISFTMACYSGGVVKEIEKRRSSWENYKKEGRTFFVMSSSPASQTSSTGTGNGEKPGAPMGSSGSAFGHALWKSLAGDADGYVDGVKDGFVDLGEIEAYTKFKTQQIGGHMPQVAGSYNPSLIMNKVVTSADKILLSNPDRGTDNLDDYAVAEMIRQEDAYWSTQVHSLPSWEDLGY